MSAFTTFLEKRQLTGDYREEPPQDRGDLDIEFRMRLLESELKPELEKLTGSAESEEGDHENA